MRRVLSLSSSSSSSSRSSSLFSLLARKTGAGASSSRSVHGIAFDVDGVLVRGKTILPGVPAMLRKLQENRVPFIFMTNGGGLLEKDKATQMSKMFDLELTEDQVLLSHTPMKPLAAKYENDLVLAVGKKNTSSILASYGFRNTVTVGEYHSQYPLTFPDFPPELRERDPRIYGQPVKAIMCLMDPAQWHREIQICLDLLRSTDGTPGTISPTQNVPIYFSGPDLEYVTEMPTPRLGSGCFGMVLDMLYEKTAGKKLEATQYGKPYPATYAHAETMLNDLATKLGHPAVTQFYGVGDNPKSDIAGANAAGDNWKSVMVRTGMFEGPGDNDVAHPADVVFDNVVDFCEQTKFTH